MTINRKNLNNGTDMARNYQLCHNTKSMAHNNETQVKIGPQGRLVIPAPIRKTLDLQPGDTLSARVRDGQLVLEKPEQVLARLKASFASVPADVSLVDELVSERRAEARRETPR